MKRDSCRLCEIRPAETEHPLVQFIRPASPLTWLIHLVKTQKCQISFISNRFSHVQTHTEGVSLHVWRVQQALGNQHHSYFVKPILMCIISEIRIQSIVSRTLSHRDISGLAIVNLVISLKRIYSILYIFLEQPIIIHYSSLYMKS